MSNAEFSLGEITQRQNNLEGSVARIEGAVIELKEENKQFYEKISDKYEKISDKIDNFKIWGVGILVTFLSAGMFFLGTVVIRGTN